MSSTNLEMGIVGLPNVGKSTLFNAITSTKNAQAANLQFFRRAPRAITAILPHLSVKRVSILSDSLVSVSRRTMPFVTMYGVPAMRSPPYVRGARPPLFTGWAGARPPRPPASGRAYRPEAPRSCRTIPKTVRTPSRRPPSKEPDGPALSLWIVCGKSRIL